jgi:hypothetical protein
MKTIASCILIFAVASVTGAPDQPTRQSPANALRKFNDLIGSWRATGTPEGTREEKQRGFWTEAISWKWQFKEKDVALVATITKGKHFKTAEMRFLPDTNRFALKLVTPADVDLLFEGSARDNVVTFDRKDDKSGETQRVVLSMFHGNRYVYRYETKAAGRVIFTKIYSVGCTKEGVAFAGPGDNSPECVVSGGLGKIKVTYKGQTYYVCCSGCQDAFKDDPEKYLKEYADRKAKEKGP